MLELLKSLHAVNNLFDLIPRSPLLFLSCGGCGGQQRKQGHCHVYGAILMHVL